MAQLHERGIVHRDVKLENIMLRSDQPQPIDPVLVDFGLAVKGPVQAGVPVCGTPGYIAPEIFEESGYDTKCDVFSLGVVFHFLYVRMELDYWAR